MSIDPGKGKEIYDWGSERLRYHYRDRPHSRYRGTTQPFPELGTFYRRVGGEGNIFYDLLEGKKKSGKTSTREAQTILNTPLDRLMANFNMAIEREMSGSKDYVPFSDWYNTYMEEKYMPALESHYRGGGTMNRLPRGRNIDFQTPGAEIGTWGGPQGTFKYDKRRALFDALNAYGLEHDLLHKTYNKLGPTGVALSGV
jgi:hypothetical protein